MDSTPLTDKLREFFAAHDSGVACAYLFGSEARGTAGPCSDIDIAVLYAHTPPSTLEGLGLDLVSELESRLHRGVDLVVLNRASPDLVHRILRDGELIFEAEPATRVRFEVKSRREYFDVLPYLREYRRAAAQRPL